MARAYPEPANQWGQLELTPLIWGRPYTGDNRAAPTPFSLLWDADMVNTLLFQTSAFPK